LTKKGVRKKRYAISTEHNIRGIKLRWKKYGVSMSYTLWTRVLENMQLQCTDGRKAVIVPPALHEGGYRDVPEAGTRRVLCAGTEYPFTSTRGSSGCYIGDALGIAPRQKRSMPSRDWGGVEKDETGNEKMPES
jgi:hypothetical protein